MISDSHLSKYPADGFYFLIITTPDHLKSTKHQLPTEVHTLTVENNIWHKNQVVIYIQSIEIDYIPVFG